MMDNADNVRAMHAARPMSAIDRNWRVVAEQRICVYRQRLFRLPSTRQALWIKIINVAPHAKGIDRHPYIARSNCQGVKYFWT